MRKKDEEVIEKVVNRIIDKKKVRASCDIFSVAVSGLKINLDNFYSFLSKLH